MAAPRPHLSNHVSFLLFLSPLGDTMNGNGFLFSTEVPGEGSHAEVKGIGSPSFSNMPLDCPVDLSLGGGSEGTAGDVGRESKPGFSEEGCGGRVALSFLGI